VRGWKDDATGLEQRLKDLETISRSHRMRRLMIGVGFVFGLIGWVASAVRTRPTTIVLVAGGAAFLNELLASSTSAAGIAGGWCMRSRFSMSSWSRS